MTEHRPQAWLLLPSRRRPLSIPQPLVPVLAGDTEEVTTIGRERRMIILGHRRSASDTEAFFYRGGGQGIKARGGEPPRRSAGRAEGTSSFQTLDGGFFVMAEGHREGTSMGSMTLDGGFFPPRRRPLRKDGMTLG